MLGLGFSLAGIVALGRVRAPISLAFTTSQTSTADAASYVFNACAIGTANATRRVLVCVHARAAGSTLDVSSVTVGGVSAALVAKTRNTASAVSVSAIYWAAVPAGATADIAVTLNESALRCLIQVFSLTGPSSPSVVDTKSSTAANPNAALSIPAGGAALGAASSAANTSFTVTGLAETSDDVTESNLTAASGTKVSPSGESFTATFTPLSSNNPTGVFAVFSN